MEHYLYDEGYDKARLIRVDALRGDTFQHKLEMGIIPSQFSEFASQVQKAFRGCKLRARADGVQPMHVYMDGDTYTMGSIWVSSNNEGDIQYVVSSTKVRNNKHNSYKREFRQCHSINLKTAVKNAKKYLLRLTPIDIARATSHHCYGTVTDYLDNQARKMEKLFTDVFAFGFSHAFLDLGWSAQLSTAHAEYKNYIQTIEDCNKDMYCVRVYERLGAQAFDVLQTKGAQVFDVLQTKYNANVYETTRSTTFLGSMTEEELPEGVLGKVSAMAICAYEEFVPCVGYRFDENIFYVTQ
jgi:hypothetical protein